MALNTANRAFRFTIGDRAETKFIGWLLWHGKTIYITGQEHWIPGWMHQCIRFDYTAPINLLKHFPDICTEKAAIDVKSAPKEAAYPSVTIERASFDSLKLLADVGVPTFLVWMFENGSFHGEFVNKLHPSTSDGDNGSGTPMYTVSKSELRTSKEFIDEL